MSLFTSTHSALAFAFNHTERQGVPNLLQRLADRDREPGRGLVGLDGAAQAGMILREVHQLSALQRAVIICKFSRPKPCGHCGTLVDTSERIQAVEALAQHTLSVLAAERPNLALRRGLVRRHFGQKIAMQDLAKQCGVHQNTASNHGRKVQKLLKALEHDALRLLDEKLSSVVSSSDEDVSNPVAL